MSAFGIRSSSKDFVALSFFVFFLFISLWLLLVERGEFEPHIPLSHTGELDAPLSRSYGLRRDLSGFYPTLPKFARRRASKLLSHSARIMHICRADRLKIPAGRRGRQGD